MCIRCRDLTDATAESQPHETESVESILSSDVTYRVLSDTRRRYVFHFLKQHREPVSVRELAEQVAAWENDKAKSELTSQERKRVYISLYQSHLPTLDKEGVVGYDSDRGIVQLSDATADLEIYIEVVPKGNVPWSLYYLGLTVGDALLLALAYFEVPPFDAVPHLALGVLVLVTFGISAFVQTYYARQMKFGDPGPPPELNSRT